MSNGVKSVGHVQAINLSSQSVLFGTYFYSMPYSAITALALHTIDMQYV